MVKKISLIIFSFVLVLGLVIADPVFAENEENTGGVEQTVEPVEKEQGTQDEVVSLAEPEVHMHDGIEYTCIASLEQIADSGHYCLMENAKLTNILNKGDVVLCLNGKTLTGGSNKTDIVGTNLTVEDCSHSGGITSNNYLDFHGKNTLTIVGCSITVGGGHSCLNIANDASAIINNANISGEWHAINLNSGAASVEVIDSTVTATKAAINVVTGGSPEIIVKGSTLTSTGNYWALSMDSEDASPNIVISDNTTVDTNYASAMYLRGGNIDLSDCTINADSNGSETGVIHQTGGTVNLNESFYLACSNNCDGYYVNGENAVLNINGASISSTGSEKSAVAIVNAEKVTINSGVITGGVSSSSANTQAIYIKSGTLEINGGLIQNLCGAGTDKTNQTIAAIKMNDGNPDVAINGGVISCETRDVIYVKTGDLTVNGGQIKHVRTNSLDEISRYGIDVVDGKVEINGGTVNSEYIGIHLNQSVETNDPGIVINSHNTNIDGKIGGIYNEHGKISIESVGVVSGNGYSINNNGVMSIASGNYDSNGYTVINNGDLTIEGGTFMANGLTSIGLENADGKLNVSGFPTVSGYAYGLYVNSGEVSLSGGSYSCDNNGYSPVFVESGTTGNILADGTETYSYNYYKSIETNDDNKFSADSNSLDKSLSNVAYVLKACDHASWHVNDSNDAGICDTCGIELVKFYGTSLSIGESLEMTFYVQSYIDDTSNWTVDFTRFGFVEKDGVVSEDATANKSDVSGTGISNNLIAYKYEGINPQCMTTPINATLKCGEGKELTAADTVYNYCARANAMPGTTDMQKQLMADMLNFGAAAQEYRDWHGELTYNDETKTIILANTGSEVADLMEHASKEYNTPVNSTAKLTDISQLEGWKIRSANMNFTFETNLLFNIDIPADATSASVVITNSSRDTTETTDISVSSAVSITVKPWEYSDVFIAKLMNNDTVVDGVQYSVDSYISKQYKNDTKFGKFMKMLYLYSQSAKEIKG